MLCNLISASAVRLRWLLPLSLFAGDELAPFLDDFFFGGWGDGFFGTAI